MQSTDNTATRLHRIDIDLTRTAGARRIAQQAGDCALIARWTDELNRLLEIRSAVVAGLVSSSRITD